MPAANENNQDYVYYATEQAGTGSAEGFYPLYATSGAGGTNAAENPQIGTTITNQPTRLTLTKKSDFAGETKALANIELSVLSPDGQITYAVWTNGANGMTYSTTTWVDGTTNTDDGNGITRDDGLIIGLPAGDYIVRETGTVPKGYAQAADVNLHINTNGTATTTQMSPTQKRMVSIPSMLRLSIQCSADSCSSQSASLMMGITTALTPRLLQAPRLLSIESIWMAMVRMSC